MATYINQTQMAAAASAAASPLVNFPMNLGKDSRWLTLEVCREFQRTRCTRTDLECKFAHPPPHVEIQNGRVTCCFDSIKGKCSRKEPPCKYLHPPQHLKEQLLQNGRNNLLARQQFQNIYTTPHMPIAAQPITQLAYDSLASRVNPSAVPYNPAAAAGVAAGLVHAAGHSYVMASPYAQFSHLGAGAALPVSNGYAAYGGVAMQNALIAAGMGYSPMTSVAVGPTSGSSVTTMAGSDLGGQLAPLNMPPVSSPSPVSVGGSAQSLTPKRADRLEQALPGMGMPMVKRPAMEGKAGMPMFPYHAAAYPQFIHPQPAAGYGHLASLLSNYQGTAAAAHGSGISPHSHLSGAANPIASTNPAAAAAAMGALANGATSMPYSHLLSHQSAAAALRQSLSPSAGSTAIDTNNNNVGSVTGGAQSFSSTSLRDLNTNVNYYDENDQVAPFCLLARYSVGKHCKSQ